MAEDTIPTVGEFKDMLTVTDPNEPWWSRSLAGASLGLSGLSAGLFPNWGGVRRLYRRLDDVPGPLDNAPHGFADEFANEVTKKTDDAARRSAEYLSPGVGAATRGQFFSHDWINHDLYNQLRGLVGEADFNKFLAALKKGVVGPTGESGIKIFANPVGKYTHELKIGGSAQRLLGYIDEKGVLILDKFVRGGLH